MGMMFMCSMLVCVPASRSIAAIMALRRSPAAPMPGRRPAEGHGGGLQELVFAMFRAEVMRLPVTFHPQGRRFFHFHSADWISSHIIPADAPALRILHLIAHWQFDSNPGTAYTDTETMPDTKQTPEDLAEALMPQLDAFVAFARKRIADPELAADVVQDSLLKAMKSAESLRQDENALAWFYRILRNSITDLYRRRATETKMLEKFADEPQLGQEDHAEFCKCMAGVIDTLKPEYAAVIREVDLKERPAADVAGELRTSANNLTVRLHRARHQLRERLEQTCQLCSKHGCLDCTCD
jgi:RNA polymerase sigma factor (sigma-70 family)